MESIQYEIKIHLEIAQEMVARLLKVGNENSLKIMILGLLPIISLL